MCGPSSLLWHLAVPVSASSHKWSYLCGNIHKVTQPSGLLRATTCCVDFQTALPFVPKSQKPRQETPLPLYSITIYLDTGPYHVAQASLNFGILQCRPYEGWD